jgi:ribosomal protein S12 methylthiotransferase accessory factor YcaO
MNVVKRVSDIVREMMPRFRQARLTPGELSLAIHLRGNVALYEAMTKLLQARIQGRAVIAEPSDPIQCKAMLARDGEIRWLLAELEFLYRSPANPETDDMEQPA